MKYTDNKLPFYDYLNGTVGNPHSIITNPYLNGMNMSKMDFYHAMDFPVYALYGYDDSEEDDRDWEYMRYMYPKTAKRIQKEIDEECDKLEYDGSCMFDEYPDRTRLGIIINDIYMKLKDLDDTVEGLEIENVESTGYGRDRNDGRRPNMPMNKPPYYRREDWLRHLIEVMLFNEMVNRRRRRRNRRRRY